MNENTIKFLKLVQENPTLRIIPLVEFEVVGGDDFYRWMGSIGDSRIDEFFLPGDSDRYFLKSRDTYALEDYYDCDCLDHNLDSLSIEERVAQTPWEKVIVVNIDLPEE